MAVKALQREREKLRQEKLRGEKAPNASGVWIDGTMKSRAMTRALRIKPP
jgi:hypothetical protein